MLAFLQNIMGMTNHTYQIFEYLGITIKIYLHGKFWKATYPKKNFGFAIPSIADWFNGNIADVSSSV